MLCPLRTKAACSPAEEAGEVLPEIRAYKLGKKRWSYNQVELRLGEASATRRAVVQQAVAAGGSKLLPEAHQESAIAYQIQLASGCKLLALVYLCFDQRATPPAASEAGGSSGGGGGGGSGDEGRAAGANGGDGGGNAAGGGNASSSQARYSWRLVTRADCRKGCSGIVVRAIQRFGRLGKRAWNDEQQPSSPMLSAGKPGAAGSMKDPKFMYLSLDEACTHVGAAAFRLVAGVYDISGERLLATAVSPPIRVLANNDVPTGAARIPLDAHLPADWEGWAAEEAAAGGAAAAAADGWGAGSKPLSPLHAGRALQQLKFRLADRATSSGSEESPAAQQQQRQQQPQQAQQQGQQQQQQQPQQQQPQQQAQQPGHQTQPGSPGGAQAVATLSQLAELLQQQQGGGDPGVTALTSQLLQQAAAARGQLLQAAQQLVHLETLLQAVGVAQPGQAGDAAGQLAHAVAAAGAGAGQQQQPLQQPHHQQQQRPHGAGSPSSPAGSAQPAATMALLSPFLGSASLPPLAPSKRSASQEGEQEGAAAVSTPLGPPPQPTQPLSVAPPDLPPGDAAATVEAERQLGQLLRLKTLLQAAADMESRSSTSGRAAGGGGAAAPAAPPAQPLSPDAQGAGALAAAFPAPVQKPSLLSIPDLQLG